MHTAQNKQTDKLQYQRHVLYFDFNSKKTQKHSRDFFFSRGFARVSLSLFCMVSFKCFQHSNINRSTHIFFFLHTTHQHKRVNQSPMHLYQSFAGQCTVPQWNISSQKHPLTLEQSPFTLPCVQRSRLYFWIES